MLGFGALAQLPLSTIPADLLPPTVVFHVDLRRRRRSESVVTEAPAEGFSSPGVVAQEDWSTRRGQISASFFAADDFFSTPFATTDEASRTIRRGEISTSFFAADDFFSPPLVTTGDASRLRRLLDENAFFEAQNPPAPPPPPPPSPSPIPGGGGGGAGIDCYCEDVLEPEIVSKRKRREGDFSVRQSIYNFAADIPEATRGRVVTLLERWERADLFVPEARIFRSTAALTVFGDSPEIHLRRAAVDVSFDSADERDQAVALAIEDGFYAMLLSGEHEPARALFSAPPDPAFLDEALASIQAAQAARVEDRLPTAMVLFLGVLLGILVTKAGTRSRSA